MLKSASSLLLFCCLLGRVDCTDNNQVTVKPGENATLQCNGTKGADVVMLKWRRTDLQSEQENINNQLYVLYIRDDRTYENLQLPSFKGRVKLRDPQMKDGDLSVVIRNVSMKDAGIYECHAGNGRESSQLLSNINLKVEEAGQQGGQSGDEEKEDGGEKSDSAGLIVGLLVPAVLLVVVVGGIVGGVGFLIYRKCKKQSNPDYQPPPGQVIEMLPAASGLNCESCCCSRFSAASSTFTVTEGQSSQCRIK